MSDPTEDFFNDLVQRGNLPMMAHTTATIRFDLEHAGKGNGADHWLVSLKDGNVSIAQKSGPADATMTTDKALFDRIVTGEANVLAATLRGLVNVEGDRQLCARFQHVTIGGCLSQAALDLVYALPPPSARVQRDRVYEGVARIARRGARRGGQLSQRLMLPLLPHEREAERMVQIRVVGHRL